MDSSPKKAKTRNEIFSRGSKTLPLGDFVKNAQEIRKTLKHIKENVNDQIDHDKEKHMIEYMKRGREQAD